MFERTYLHCYLVPHSSMVQVYSAQPDLSCSHILGGSSSSFSLSLPSLVLVPLQVLRISTLSYFMSGHIFLVPPLSLRHGYLTQFSFPYQHPFLPPSLTGYHLNIKHTFHCFSKKRASVTPKNRRGKARIRTISSRSLKEHPSWGFCT